MKSSDKQVAGGHYKNLSIQPSEFIHRNGLGWCEGNAVKYLSRHKSKNGRQDIEKAIHYLQLLIEWEYPDAPPVPAENVAIPPVRPSSGDGSTNGGMYRDLPRSACRTCGEDE